MTTTSRFTLVATVALVGALWTAIRGEPVRRPPSVVADASQVDPASPVARLCAWCDASIAGVKKREAVRMVTAILVRLADGARRRVVRARKEPVRLGLARAAVRRGWGPGDYGRRIHRPGRISSRDSTATATANCNPRTLTGPTVRPFVKQQGQAGQWFSRLDASSNGRITPEEWEQFFEKLAGEKGYVSRDDLRAALFPPGPKSGGASPAGQEVRRRKCSSRES